MKTYKCFRCDYSWIPRVSKPTVCPKCKSPYWKKPRVSDDGTGNYSKPIKNIYEVEDVLGSHELNEMPELKEILERE